VRQRSHYLKEETDMAMNPYEMRWDYLQTAQTRLENKLKNDIESWTQKKYLLEEKGELKDFSDPFPEYPTAEEIHAVAEEMRIFVENGAK
tara:strand:- start:339 stop:608 length:270 start_codon:yes stop_codon:yes gene_type:complete